MKAAPVTIPMSVAAGKPIKVALDIDVQIETFGQPSPLTPSNLSECRYRTERINLLGQELDRIATSRVPDLEDAQFGKTPI